MKKFAFIIVSGLFIVGCKKDPILENGTNFREARFIHGIYTPEFDKNKWINSAEEARNSIQEVDGQLLAEAIPDLETYYKNKVQYTFTFGGGCFGGKIDELSTMIKDNTLYIIWDYPKSTCPQVGEMSEHQAVLEIDKSIYPDYKNFKVEIINE